MKRLLIYTQHFSPAFRGGGPIQSLSNLVNILPELLEIRVVCSAYDLGELRHMKKVVPDKWVDFKNNVKVFYATRSFISVFKAAMNVAKADTIYINGIFSIKFNFVPLVISRLKGMPIVLSPRGMIQSGALSTKAFKKKLYISFIKLLGLHNDIRWHATDAQEMTDIINMFGASGRVIQAANVPKRPLASVSSRGKKAGTLKMVFLSVIAEKKNLHIALQSLSLLSVKIQFDIYGPVKDRRYWKKCQDLIAGSHHDIQYLGPIVAEVVQTTLSNYHVMILPTKGENFGHAIFESFSAGTPVIVGDHTPWGSLQNKVAGITVESERINEWAGAIQKFIDKSQEDFDELSQGAHKMAIDYYERNDFSTQYAELFKDALLICPLLFAF
jgi:glycosyltransferase involved in cell wall biosynthesis